MEDIIINYTNNFIYKYNINIYTTKKCYYCNNKKNYCYFCFNKYYIKKLGDIDYKTIEEIREYIYTDFFKTNKNIIKITKFIKKNLDYWLEYFQNLNYNTYYNLLNLDNYNVYLDEYIKNLIIINITENIFRQYI